MSAADSLHAGPPASHFSNASVIATFMFLAFVALSLIITWRSSKKTNSAADFYAAGGGITPLQNGFAIAGDFLSAASFLGITAMPYTTGFDGMLCGLGFLVGWLIVLFLISARLRNLGRYTFSDVTSFRLDKRQVRVERDLAGAGPDVRHGGASADPDALLHGARCTGRAQVSVLCGLVRRDIYVASTDALSRSLAELLDVLQLPHPTALARSALAELAGAIALARSEEREDVANEILESSRDALKQRLGLTVSRSASH